MISPAWSVHSTGLVASFGRTSSSHRVIDSSCMPIGPVSAPHGKRKNRFVLAVGLVRTKRKDTSFPSVHSASTSVSARDRLHARLLRSTLYAAVVALQLTPQALRLELEGEHGEHACAPRIGMRVS